MLSLSVCVICACLFACQFCYPFAYTSVRVCCVCACVVCVGICLFLPISHRYVYFLFACLFVLLKKCMYLSFSELDCIYSKTSLQRTPYMADTSLQRAPFSGPDYSLKTTSIQRIHLYSGHLFEVPIVYAIERSYCTFSVKMTKFSTKIKTDKWNKNEYWQETFCRVGWLVGVEVVGGYTFL